MRQPWDHLYRVNEGMTYIWNNHACENSFINAEPDTDELPVYEEIKDRLPIPVWEGHQDSINCYYKAWEIAFSNLRKANPEAGFVSNFIDTAFNGFLFMWDTSFILMFGKYGSRIFNFQKTLDNMYSHQHWDGYICREICETENGEHFFRHDPSSTGPNVMAWSEWVYYQNTGDKERIKRVFPVLLAYYQWLRENRTWPDGSYWSTGWGCGMDNVPRLQPGYHEMFSHGHMIWVDACLHQIISGKILCKMAEILGREDAVESIKEEIPALADLVNNKLWDPETSFYYDMWKNGQLNGVKSVGSYWALLADIVPEERIKPFVAHLNDEKSFKRPHRVPSLAADQEGYDPEGSYWKGSVWAPTTYMVLKGLEEIKDYKLAYEIARNHHDNVVKVYTETDTLWENYAPEQITRGNQSQPNFVGWSGLPAISVLFEHVMGIMPDGQNNKITWNVNLTEHHGIKQYPLGTEAVLDLDCAARENEDEKPVITVKSNVKATVEVIWKHGSFIIDVEP